MHRAGRPLRRRGGCRGDARRRRYVGIAHRGAGLDAATVAAEQVRADDWAAVDRGVAVYCADDDGDAGRHLPCVRAGDLVAVVRRLDGNLHTLG